MFRKHVIKELSAYYHGELSDEDSRRVGEHLLKCPVCRREFDEIKLGASLAEYLPHVSAPESMWSGIEAMLDRPAAKGVEKHSRSSPPLNWYRLAAINAVLLSVLGGVAVWYFTRSPKNSWEVAPLEGAPTVGPNLISAAGRLKVGEWLETNGSSRARINVGNIGQVEIDPNTRVRLVETRVTEYRLALARGRMQATIWAPPRLFFVDTPSAVAVDYGCAYTLEVDDAGRSRLRVTAGWVALVLNGHESMVPAGALCETRPGIGPGTPYFEDASEAFRQALGRLDFESGGDEALHVLLAESRTRDALTLWHLFRRVGGAGRVFIYNRLATLVAPPEGVTRDGVVRLDQQMLDRWREKIDDDRFSISPGGTATGSKH